MHSDHGDARGGKGPITALTVRLPAADASEVKRIAKRERRSASEVGARIIDEWLRQNRFPLLEFRSVYGERVACIKGRLEVWQVVAVAKNYDYDAEATAQHLELRTDQVRSALDYASVYAEEVESCISEAGAGFEAVRRVLPGAVSVRVGESNA
jgi:uncharacterized protein (DUF433 family)